MPEKTSKSEKKFRSTKNKKSEIGENNKMNPSNGIVDRFNTEIVKYLNNCY